jgi:hypothetical protein
MDRSDSNPIDWRCVSVRVPDRLAVRVAIDEPEVQDALGKLPALFERAKE